MSTVALAPIEIPPVDCTPVDFVQSSGIWMKRDDLFRLHGVNGSKVYEALAIAKRSEHGLIGYGSRWSCTAAAMGAAAKELGVSASFHAPHGGRTPELEVAEALGVRVVRQKPGYLSQCRAAASHEALLSGASVGLAHEAAIVAVAGQVRNVPVEVERIVLPVGSGVLLAGVCLGLLDTFHAATVIGVVVGAQPDVRMLDLYAPTWRQFTHLVPSELPYERGVQAKFRNVELDPLYEAKTIDLLRKGDMLWNSGIRTLSL